LLFLIFEKPLWAVFGPWYFSPIFGCHQDKQVRVHFLVFIVRRDFFITPALGHFLSFWGYQDSLHTLTSNYLNIS
jgi:hypothetical protein